jgi:hypothetical protein
MVWWHMERPAVLALIEPATRHARSAARERRVTRWAERLRLQHLSSFFERVVACQACLRSAFVSFVPARRAFVVHGSGSTRSS